MTPRRRPVSLAAARAPRTSVRPGGDRAVSRPWIAEALASDLVERVTVIEIEPAVIAWSRAYLAARSGGALEDPRVEVVCADLVDWLGSTEERYEAARAGHRSAE